MGTVKNKKHESRPNRKGRVTISDTHKPDDR